MSTPLDPCPIGMKYEVRGAFHNHSGPPVQTAMEIGTMMHTGRYSYMDESRPLRGKSVLERKASRRLQELADRGLLKIHRMSSVRPNVPNVWWSNSQNWIQPINGNRAKHVPIFDDEACRGK